MREGHCRAVVSRGEFLARKEQVACRIPFGGLVGGDRNHPFGSFRPVVRKDGVVRRKRQRTFSEIASPQPGLPDSVCEGYFPIFDGSVVVDVETDFVAFGKTSRSVGIQVGACFGRCKIQIEVNTVEFRDRFIQLTRTSC